MLDSESHNWTKKHTNTEKRTEVKPKLVSNRGCLICIIICSCQIATAKLRGLYEWRFNQSIARFLSIGSSGWRGCLDGYAASLISSARAACATRRFNYADRPRGRSCNLPHAGKSLSEKVISESPNQICAACDILIIFCFSLYFSGTGTMAKI